MGRERGLLLARKSQMRRGLTSALTLTATLTASGLVASAAQAATTAGDWSSLVTAISAGGTVQLTADITAPSGDNLVIGSTAVTLDLNGFSLSITSPSSYNAAVEVPDGDALTIEDTSSATPGRLTATGGVLGAGIGGSLPASDGETAGSITIDGGTVDATGGVAAPGIGGAAGSGTGGSGGSLTIAGGDVTATSGENGAPAIGGGAGNFGGGSGGSVTITAGTVTAVGGSGGNGDPGIGGGAAIVSGQAGSGATLTIAGGNVTATGSPGGEGIGGGTGNGAATTVGSGGTVKVTGGTLVTTGGVGASGIGSGALNGGLPADDADVTIGPGATVTASGTGAYAIGSDDPARFGSLINGGELIIPVDQLLAVPSSDAITNQSTGTIQLYGPLSGEGTVLNYGVINLIGPYAAVSDGGAGNGTTGLEVLPNNYTLSFDDNGGSGATPGDEQLYAPSLTAGGMSLPGAPTLPAQATSFNGWFTGASGGSVVDATTALASKFGSGPSSDVLYAQYEGVLGIATDPASQEVTAGQDVTFTAAVTGYPAPTVQWYSSTDGGGTWQPIAGADSDTLTLPSVSVSQSGTMYRAVFTNSLMAATTNNATLTVDPASQVIDFTPLSGDAMTGTAATLSATGGGSGQPVQFSVGPKTSPADTCSVSQASTGSGTVSFAHAGTCEVLASQAGSADGNYGAGATASQMITVAAQPATVKLSAPDSVVYGQAGSVSAVVGEQDGSTATGTVQFTEAGKPLGAPVALVDGEATSPNLNGGLAPGAYQVGASFTPADPTVYAAGSATDVTQPVTQAASAVTVTVGNGSLSATVSAVKPGAGTPTGTVNFALNGQPVGSATLSNGTATLAATLPAGATNGALASYAGDADFSAAAASNFAAAAPASTPVMTTVTKPVTPAIRIIPKISAHVSSSKPKSRYGWYSTPVRVSFTCSAKGAKLLGGCPAAVTLSRNGAHQSLSRAIKASGGGTATVHVRGINIDRQAPQVRIAGIRRGLITGSTGTPAASCVAHDSLSGIASCHLTRRVNHGSTGLDTTTVVVTATATDRAGNRSVSRSSYRTLGIYLQGASYSGGAFQISLGRSYTLIVNSASSQPRYVDAGPTPPGPGGLDNAFHSLGHGRWAIGVNFSTALGNPSTWQFGVLIGGSVHVVTVHAS
jgi:hypothetical protein